MEPIEEPKAGLVEKASTAPLVPTQEVAPLPTPRQRHASAPMNGKLYVFGGTVDGATRTTDVLEYDPVADSWTEKQDIPITFGGVTDSVAVPYDGEIYLLGGDFSGGPDTNVASYNPGSDSWTTQPDMPTAHADHGAGVADGNLYVYGGVDGSGITGATQFYDGSSWSSDPDDMGTPRRSFASIGVPDFPYAIGGVDGSGNVLASVERVFAGIGLWTNLDETLNTAREDPAVAIRDGTFYVIGGQDSGGSVLTSIETSTDPQNNGWTAEGDIRTARRRHVATSTGDDLFVVGGRNKSDGLLASNERFTFGFPTAFQAEEQFALLVDADSGGAAQVRKNGSPPQYEDGDVVPVFAGDTVEWRPDVQTTLYGIQ